MNPHYIYIHHSLSEDGQSSFRRRSAGTTREQTAGPTSGTTTGSSGSGLAFACRSDGPSWRKHEGLEREHLVHHGDNASR